MDNYGVQLREIKTIKRSPDILTADFPSRKVIFNTVTRRPYVLNRAASEIWDYCKKPIDIDDIALRIREKYGIKKARAKNDVSKFLKAMRKKGILE